MISKLDFIQHSRDRSIGPPFWILQFSSELCRSTNFRQSHRFGIPSDTWDRITLSWNHIRQAVLFTICNQTKNMPTVHKSTKVLYVFKPEIIFRRIPYGATSAVYVSRHLNHYGVVCRWAVVYSFQLFIVFNVFIC